MERLGSFERPNFIEKSKKSIERKAIDFIVDSYFPDFSERGWEAVPDAMNKYLESLGVKVRYDQEDNREFSEMRNKLNSESGIVISNHPAGYIDVPIVLSNIHREDFKSYVAEKVYNAFTQAFENKFGIEGRDLVQNKLIPNTPSKARENFKVALKHIEDGGLLLLHPTQGEDRHSTDKVTFKPGLRLFLRNMKPSDMIYSFNINANDMQNNFGSPLKTATRFAGLASEELISDKININDLRKDAVANVDERYDTVADWQDYDQDDESLTSYYWSKFKK